MHILKRKKTRKVTSRGNVKRCDFILDVIRIYWKRRETSTLLLATSLASSDTHFPPSVAANVFASLVVERQKQFPYACGEKRRVTKADRAKRCIILRRMRSRG